MKNRKQLEENAEDAFLALLMNDFAEREGEYYMAENERLQNDPSAAVPEDVDRRALQLIEREFAKKKRSASNVRVLRVLGRGMIAVAIVSLLFVAAYALSPAVRAGTLNFLMQFDSQMATWQFEADGSKLPGFTSSNIDTLDIIVDWVPEGYDRQTVLALSPSDRMLDLVNDQGDLIRVSVHASEDFINTLDLEDADYFANIIIQGTDGILIEKDNTVTIDWAYDNSAFVVSVESRDVDASILTTVAESVRIIN